MVENVLQQIVMQNTLQNRQLVNDTPISYSTMKNIQELLQTLSLQQENQEQIKQIVEDNKGSYDGYYQLNLQLYVQIKYPEQFLDVLSQEKDVQIRVLQNNLINLKNQIEQDIQQKKVDDNYILRFINTQTINFLKRYLQEINSVYYFKNINTKSIQLTSKQITSYEKIQSIHNIVDQMVSEYIESQLHLSQKTTIINQNTIKEQQQEILESQTQKSQSYISTGFNSIDMMFNGGFQRGRLYFILGKTGGGKSQFSLQLTKNMLQEGYNVLYITLENTIEETKLRLFQNISGVSLETFHTNQETVQKSCSEFFNNPKTGTLMIDYFPQQSISIKNIQQSVLVKNQMLQQQQQTKQNSNTVDVIIIDYLDLLKQKQENERVRLITLQRIQKQLQQEMNVVVITPSQVHRQQYRSQKIELDNVSESFGKLQEQDGVLILEPFEDDDKKIKINIGKNRHGKSGYRVVLDVDFNTMKFKDTGIIISQNEMIEKTDQKQQDQDKDLIDQFYGNVLLQ